MPLYNFVYFVTTAEEYPAIKTNNKHVTMNKNVIIQAHYKQLK